MLVLSRKANERILIGEDIEIVVVRISQNTVRIGIEAPLEFTILRDEVLSRDADEGDDDA